MDWALLLKAPELGLSGLLGSSCDSLVVDRDGGLVVRAAPKDAICGGTGEGLCFKGNGFGVLPPTMKLPTTT